MKRPTVAILSRQGRAGIPSPTWRRLASVAQTRFIRRDRAPEHDEAIELLADADVLGATNLCLPQLDGRLLDGLPRLRGVVLYATGYDHVDVDLLRSRGVGLSVLPDYATVAVAEHAVALMLTLAARVHLAHDRSRGLAAPDVSLRGVELAGRTLGVIGTGRIGRRVATLGAAFGMTVIGADPDRQAALHARSEGVQIHPLPALLTGADVVAVCASHRFGGPAILGEAELSLLSTDALVVNVGRAALVDTSAVVGALRARRLRGYAVDDTVCDPVLHADVLREGRIVQTGHSAWWRDETLDRGGAMWAERLIAAAAGTPLDSVTWPTDTGQPVAGLTR